ncbi:MAG: hypothetical protein JWQ97_1254 [Phenylobacterium sp.]|nr:hypothetical protein [Phenylobacterium sp.]
MTAFSASDAALEGFNLIRRQWRVVLGWAGFNLLALIMLVVVTVVLGVVAATVSGGSRGAAATLVTLSAGLGGLVLQAIVAGGVFRLETRPDEPAFLHLRLGRDELRLVVVWLVTITAAWAIWWVARSVGEAAGRGGFWIGLLFFAGGVYLALRFALAAPVSFVERRIDFPRAWRLTRGHVLALLGMTALSFCLIALLMVTVMVALALVAAGVGGLDAVGGLFGGGAEALRRHPGVYALEFAVQIVLTPILWVLGVTPLIAAYRALAAPAA